MDRGCPSVYPVGAMSSSGFLKPVIGGIGVIVFLAAVFFIARFSGSAAPEGMILYYGDGCPHCAKVDAFLDENHVEQRVRFERKEVYNNKKNAREMGNLAKRCGFATESIGIPFFWTGTTCLTGDQDIIAFFRSRMGIPAQSSSSQQQIAD